MDAFLAICQALGFGLAAGTVSGAFAPRTKTALPLIAFAIVLGGVAGALAPEARDESVPAGIAAGVLGAAIAAPLVHDVSAGARRRAEGASAPVGLLLAVAAVAVAGLSLLLPPLSLLALVALLLLAAGRRRRAGRKYEGLRILR